MNTRIRYGAASALGFVLLTFSQMAWSLGLGDARVKSFLNQPLEIEIGLISQPSDDLGAIVVGLASAADYELIGASRNDISVPLSFSVEGAPGNAYIVVSSALPVNDPVVRLIVEVNSASGRMLREYTLFLDPATYSQPAPRVNTPSSKPATPADSRSPSSAAELSPGKSTSPSATTGEPVRRQGSFGSSGEYGPVQSGETLWRIAKDWSEGTGLSINQVMVAIQRNNPRAFSKDNINLLQRGAILRMPSIEEVESISVAEAISQVREQAAEFSMQRDITSASTPLLVDENTSPQAVQPPPEPQPEAQQEASPAIEPDEVAEPADTLTAEPSEPATLAGNENLPMDDEPQPQLELVPPSEDSMTESVAGAEEAESGMESTMSEQDLREELARREEELINQQQQNAYLEQRLKELESQVAEAEAVEDKNLASMEERLRQERLAKEAEEKPWYGGLTLLWVGLLIIVVALAGWLLSRRGGSFEADDTSETLRGIQDEAEEVLKVLDSGDREDASEEDETLEQPVAEAVEPEDDEVSDETVIAPAPARDKKRFGGSQDEAEVLDEESADPEIQLDLARAYISMGDKEAARVILDEVESNGSEKQKAEAMKMKSLL